MDEGVEAAEVSSNKRHLGVAVPLMARISADLQRIIVNKAASSTTTWSSTAACKYTVDVSMMQLTMSAARVIWRQLDSSDTLIEGHVSLRFIQNLSFVKPHPPQCENDGDPPHVPSLDQHSCCKVAGQ